MGRRGKHAVFSEADLNRASEIVRQLSYGDSILMALSVLLAGKLKLTSAQIASILGVSKPTVVRMNERFRQMPESGPSNWGGDRRSILTEESRREVLAGLEKEAAAGKIVVVEQVKKAIEQKCGAPISLQTAYNILHREGWRKVKPDKIHPKGDPLKQDHFKKKTSQKQWRWLPPTRKPLASSCE